MTGRFSFVGRFLSRFDRSVAAGRPEFGRRSLRLGRGLWVIIVWVLILNFASVGAGEITFDSGISHGMVVQRGQPVVLSGTGAPRAALTLTLGAQSELVAIEDDGRWKAVFSAMPHGGPYTLSASAGSHVVCINDVWVGDVWVASGQSNMQMGLAETIGGREVLAELNREPAIRFLEVPRGGADVPKPRLEAGWQRASPELLARFSAVACYFAAHLRREPALADVPLGLINSSFGGTSIEAWSPAGSLAGLPQDRLSGSMFGIPPGALFNAMIHPLFARPIKGVLWYQGEANAGQPALYVKLLRNMMEQWRLGWGQGDLPFLIVQLPAFEGRMGSLDFSWLREAQDKASDGFSNAWSVVTYDTTDGFDLHPKEKEEIGRRLALVAKKEVYGLNVNAHGPRPRNIETSGQQLSVTFDQGLKAARGQNPRGFMVAGEDGDYRFAEATIEGKTVLLESATVSLPKTIRYAWGGLTEANLTGLDGLPAFGFRSDELAPESMFFQTLPAFQRIETPVYSLETGKNGCIASLIVRDKQFLSNESVGGTAVPGGFGFRNLAATTVLGPRRITLSDGGVTLEVACFEREMVWTLTPQGSESADVHINLSAAVEARFEWGTATLFREGVQIELTGIDRLEGRRIIAKAPPQGCATLRFLIKTPG